MFGMMIDDGPKFYCAQLIHVFHLQVKVTDFDSSCFVLKFFSSILLRFITPTLLITYRYISSL